MANPTTYFGWVMPNSADLVTDLPADFNVFGQGVDTSMQFLLGGTTGQVLSKTSATNMAFTWINNDQGDITGVTAGTGITGGGTSGTVTVTNDMATTITAAGDIVVGTGSGTYDNLPIGTTAQVLTADTTVSPYKVKWATPSSTPSFAGTRLNKVSGSQAIADSTFVAVTWPTEVFDVGGYHDTTTNTSRITIPAGKGGYYRFSWSQGLTAAAASCMIYTNGTGGTRSAFISTVSGNANQASIVLSLAVADYVEVYLRQTTGSSQTAFDEANGAIGFIWFDCNYLGA